MRRVPAVVIAVLVSVVGVAAPAFAEDSTNATTCVKLRGEGYTQVVCEDTDGNRVSVTTYFDNGCTTTADASGESSTCPEDVPLDPPTDVYYPSDASCDVEVLANANGVEYKFVTCRDADGNVVSQARYTQDGCVTKIDADGNESTSCPASGCSTTVDADGNEFTSCPDISFPQWYPIDDYSAFTSVSQTDDGCWVIGKSDSTSVIACPDPTPTDVTAGLSLDNRGCVIQAGPDGMVWGVDCPGTCYFSTDNSTGQPSQVATCVGGNTPEDMTPPSMAVCDVQLLQVDGRALTLGVCDDGCTLVNGMPTKDCAAGWLYSWGIGQRTTLWVKSDPSSDYSPEGMTCWTKSDDESWVSTDCTQHVLYSKGLLDGDVVRSTDVFTFAPTEATVVDALAISGALRPQTGEGRFTAAADVAAAQEESAFAQAAGEDRDATATALTAAPVTARDSAPGSPVSPATAAVAIASVGAAGVATSQVRLRLRRG
ncbi:MAG: hypothetical protein KGP01_05200 [Actinomycetales bacterium]|nr:hypothetical protein [Actinomycetales bacterium]